VVATGSKEDKLGLTYKVNATEEVHLNAGYSYSDRRTSNDLNAIAAFIGNQTLQGTPGLNGGDFIGFHPFFDGSRTQQILKAGADWSVSDKLSLGASGRYTDDNYNTTYGVQGGNTWSLNLDSTFNYSDVGSIFAYLTKEYRARDLTSLYKTTTTGSSIRTASPAPWTNNLTDQDVTFGLGAKQSGLVGGKLSLVADLSYSLGKTSYGTQMPTDLLTSGGLNCLAASILQCGDLPDIKNITTQVKLVGDYKVNKNGKVQLGYIYRNLKSSDYYYNALQYNYTPTSLIPTNQQSGSYSVNVVSATYIYTF
jgi:MtrB/PioB family decaheme-associated outer membrane protein